MMIRILLISLLLLFIGSTVAAQNPGYLGKKATLLVNVPSFPTIWGPTWNNRGLTEHYGEDGGGLAISPVLEFEFGYTISREQQLKLAYDRFRTGAIVVVSTPTKDPSNGGFGQDEHSLFYQLSASTISLGRKKFNLLKGAIAPLGAYGGINLRYTRVSGEIADKRTDYFGNGEQFGHEPIIIDSDVTYFAVGLEAGIHGIYWDRLVTNLGFRFNVPLNGRRIGYAIEGGLDTSVDDEDLVQETYTQAVFERLALHSLVQFNLGIGVLLF